jgi:hypothetical protein
MRHQKITLGELRVSGVHGLLIYCADYKCSHRIAVSASGISWRTIEARKKKMATCLGPSCKPPRIISTLTSKRYANE